MEFTLGLQLLLSKILGISLWEQSTNSTISSLSTASSSLTYGVAKYMTRSIRIMVEVNNYILAKASSESLGRLRSLSIQRLNLKPSIIQDTLVSIFLCLRLYSSRRMSAF